MVAAHLNNVEAPNEPYQMAPAFPLRYHARQMCTVSWLHNSDGYILLCNRDERRTRRPARGPQIAGGVVRYIAPVDGDHGGSWIGVNNLGLTLCLLNRYGEWRADPDREYTSRGLLLTGLLELEAQERVREQIAQVDLERFQPFTMVALATGEPAALFDWTGAKLLIEPDADSLMPLTSSSMSEAGTNVVKLRKQQFEKLLSQSRQVDADTLFSFHRSHEPARGPCSICMHRDDAETVSLSVVRTSAATVEFTYFPGSPCLNLPAEEADLPRLAIRTCEKM